MKIIQKGFTLIELLIVIAVLGVLAAAVVTAINPAKRIKQANDAKIKNDVGQLATALQAYYTTNETYPETLNLLTVSGDLKTIPTAPTGSSYILDVPADCTAALKTCTEVALHAQLLDPGKDVDGNTLGIWCWRSAAQTTTEVGSVDPDCLP